MTTVVYVKFKTDVLEVSTSSEETLGLFKARIETQTGRSRRIRVEVEVFTSPTPPYV
jgi:hypothetical protein